MIKIDAKDLNNIEVEMNFEDKESSDPAYEFGRILAALYLMTAQDIKNIETKAFFECITTIAMESLSELELVSTSRKEERRGSI